jgi:hypothetical protein
MVPRVRLIAGLVVVLVLGFGCGGSPNSPSDPPDVEYRVSAASRASLITYANRQGGTSQVSDVGLPWSFSFDDPSAGQFLYVSAQNAGTGPIRVEIFRRGQLFQSSMSTGQFVIATASGTY